MSKLSMWTLYWPKVENYTRPSIRSHEFMSKRRFVRLVADNYQTTPAELLAIPGIDIVHSRRRGK